ncbi:sugar ABC transporter permease [Streptomyces sp. H34-S4]|uniref:sugar ABC transporter permease n=1 Tax=Streptomyces sp. H34-S4 TaxID=2996463 RepID=UPI00227122D6|nr:sugar ABC transporter permease [Streptomyces sp. H34-S4]MCY0933128.1 sugar ABC transporter permease [Streptomyces sp. H34-S4]
MTPGESGDSGEPADVGAPAGGTGPARASRAPGGEGSPSWAEQALAEVLDRVGATAAEVGERFPLYADPDTGRWTTTGRGSWAGGFWAGLLWLRARHTGAAAHRAAASACTARLAGWVDADTSTRGLILWYGTALAGTDTGARELRTRAAGACLAAMDTELGLLPWGSAFGGPRLLARVDGLPGTVPLLAAAGPRGEAAAAAHLHRHLTLCLPTADAPPFVPAWSHGEETGWRPCAEPTPGWSRGPAWLLLALADVLHRPAVAGRLPGRPRDRVERLADSWTGPATALVPPADAARPTGLPDTSAAAVTAVALLKLARLPGAGAARYAHRAAEILRCLVDTHLVGGRLLDGCYDADKGLAVRHELVWGDFFLALGLAELTGLADVRTI